MKNILSIVLFLAVAVAAFGAEGKPVVKIGVNIGLSGNGAVSLVQPIQKALLMGVKELNSRPSSPYQYQLVFEDNQWTPRGSVLAAERMISLNKVDTLITIADYAMGPTAPVAKRHHVANLGYAWGTDKADGTYNFIFGDSELGYAAAFYSAVKNSPLKTGILAVRQSSIPRFVDEMQRLAKADGKADFPIIFINTESVDFRTIILRLDKQYHLEQLVVILYGDDLNKFMYQLQQSDYRPAFAMKVDDVDSIKTNLKLLLTKGTIVAACAAPEEEFQKRYKAYAKEEATRYAAFGYDILKLLAESLESSPPSTAPLREQIARALATKENFTGVSGSYTQSHGVFDTFPKLYRLTPTGEEPFIPNNP